MNMVALSTDETKAVKRYIATLLNNLGIYANTLDPDTITEVITSPSMKASYKRVKEHKRDCVSGLAKLGLKIPNPEIA